VKHAGFKDVKIIDKMIYSSESISTLAGDACGCGGDNSNIDQKVVDKYADKVASVKLYARKPK